MSSKTMLNLNNFALKSQFNNFSSTLIYYPILIYPKKIIKFSLKNANFFNFGCVSAKIPSGFCLKASNTQGNVKKIEKIDQESDKDEVFGFLDDDFDDDDDEVIIDLKNMKKWRENKPRGFGEGKEYETLVEDNLMEEIEQSRKAQVVNVNKLKNSNAKDLSKKNEQDKKIKDVEEGYRVRLVNLPKKKNIHKDLRLAFAGVPGLISIVPAVYGNKKTRDPICKGLAFVSFKSENEALRFVQTFSKQSIAFGKVQKQIKCELLKSEVSMSAPEQSIDTTHSASQLEGDLDENPDAKSETNVPHIQPSEEMSFPEDAKRELPTGYTLLNAVFEEEEDEEEEEEEEDEISQIVDKKPFISEAKYFERNIETSGRLEPDSDVDVEAGKEPIPVPYQSKQQKKIPANVKRDSPKKKKEKSSKLTIPGSSKRLRVREKAMLTDVFSKYVPQAALATEERR
ncbi:hypothetical protein Leryth_009935 [Lithospermum erythrorhizon]|nr:hypothetical protein Leryth_009935 [Lithospermum erythrorhizon]